MVSCSGSLVQSCCGEGGALQTDIAVRGEPSPCSGHTGFTPLTGVCFPIYTAQAPGCSIWSGPCVACGSSFRVLHKSADSAAPAFCAFPGRAAQAARSLKGALSPGAGRAFSPPRPQPQFPPAPVGCGCVRLVFSHDPPGGCRPSRISGGLWLETGGLFAVW